eukprot:4451089-Prymnesium_polylepis.1
MDGTNGVGRKAQRVGDKENNGSGGMEVIFDNAPVCTIDVNALKPSRFLLAGPPPALPFRDEHGRVNVHLLRGSAAEVAAGRAPNAAQLQRWLDHAERWLRKLGSSRTWKRSSDGMWMAPDGEKRPEVGGVTTPCATSGAVPPTATAATAAGEASDGFDTRAFDRDGFVILRSVIPPD